VSAMTAITRTPVVPEAAPVGALSAQLRRPRPRTAMSAKRRLCGKTRKMPGRENLSFTRRTSSARVIVTIGRMGGQHAARSPAWPNPAEFSFKVVYCRLNCDRREKSSFSTQSVEPVKLKSWIKAKPPAASPSRRHKCAETIRPSGALGVPQSGRSRQPVIYSRTKI
jgi:hypothetical protein